MAFFERLGARVVIGTGEKIIRRLARDAKMKRKGRAQGRSQGRDEVFKLWRSGMSYAQAKKELER